jgi:hypothetical protein
MEIFGAALLILAIIFVFAAVKAVPQGREWTVEPLAVTSARSNPGSI